MNRQEAIGLVKELLENCTGLDGHSLELSPTNSPSEYQIIIKGALDQQSEKQLQAITTKHQLAIQTGSLWRTKRSLNKTEPDTFIIYCPKKSLPK